MSTADAAMTAGKASDDARDGSLATGTYRAELRSWANQIQRGPGPCAD